jgi:hypothetical protein
MATAMATFVGAFGVIFTGVVQATALAPTGARRRGPRQAAVLSGPDGAAAWVRDGGVVVLDDGTHRVVPAGAA